MDLAHHFPRSPGMSMASHSLAPWALAVLVCAPVLAQKSPDVRIDTGTPPSAYDSSVPRLAASGDAVFAVWRDARTLVGTILAPDIYFNRSFDRGSTWSPAETRISTGTFPFGLTMSCFNASIANEGSHLYVSWTAYPVGSGLPGDVYFNRSTDIGASWLAQSIRLDVGTPPSGATGGSSALTLDMAASADCVYVIWIDTRADNPGLYFNRSIDAGTTWLTDPPRIDTAAWPSDGSSDFPEIACSADVVAVTWRGRLLPSNEWAAFVNVSHDQGTTWLPQPLRLNTNPPGTSSSGIENCVDGRGIFVVWTDHHLASGAQSCSLNRSLDAGATWLAVPARVSSPAARAYSPQVSAIDDSVYVAWYDYRAPPTGIYFNHSADDGTTWQPVDTRLDTGNQSGAGSSWQQQIAGSDDSVYATWLHQNDTTGDTSTFLNRSSDRGATWLPAAVRMNQDGGIGACNIPTVAASKHGAYVAWMDARNGAASDIYFNIPSGAVAFGSGSTGTGGIAPVLTVDGAASIGSVVSCEIRGGLGGAGAWVRVGLRGAATLGTACPAWFLGSSIFALPFALDGAPGSPGGGRGARKLAIPIDPTLLGTSWSLQGVVRDPGAACGTAATQGVELWIL
jgi:hypothetical protein